MIAFWVWALPLGVVVLALGNRLRGGLWGDRIGWGTNVARLLAWSLPYGLVGWMFGLPLPMAAAFVPAAFVGCTVGQYGGLAMGHRGAAPAMSPWLTMAGWGMARVLLPVGIMAAADVWMGGHFAPLWALASGLLCPLAYDLVWRVPSAFYLPGLGYGGGAATGYDPPELAEALMGAIMAAGLFMAVTG